MNIDRLMTPEGMRAFTAKCRDRHQQADTQYGQIGEIVRRRLAQERIKGDRFYSPYVRAFKVNRQFRKLARLSRKAAATAEAVNSSYIHNVLEVEGAREQKAVEKARKKQGYAVTASGFAEKSLTKTADAFNGVSTQVTDGSEQPVTSYLDPEPTHLKMASGSGIQHSGRTGTVYDHFPQGGRR